MTTHITEYVYCALFLRVLTRSKVNVRILIGCLPHHLLSDRLGSKIYNEWRACLWADIFSRTPVCVTRPVKQRKTEVFNWKEAYSSHQ
jgi:hypothetical protein